METRTNDKDTYKLWLDRGLQLLSAGEYVKAMEEFERAITSSPVRGDAYFHRGEAFYALGRFDKAVKSYGDAIRFNHYASTYDERHIAEQACMKRGIIFHNQGDLEQARKDFAQAVIFNPYNVSAHTHLGMVYRDAGYYESALHSFTAAIGRASRNADIRCLRADLFAMLGKMDKALEDYNKAVALNHQHIQALYGRAIILLNQNRRTDALKDLTAVQKIKPNDVMALALHAYVNIGLRNYALVHFDLQHALEVDRHNTSVHLCRGMLNRALDDAVNAACDFSFVWSRAESLTVKLYAGIQLILLTRPCVDLRPFVRELEEKPVKTAEELCLLALALLTLKDYSRASQCCEKLLSCFLPAAIPHYLQKEFITILLHSENRMRLDAGKLPDVYELKQQMLNMLLTLDDKELLLNACLQSLCAETSLGSIMYIQRLNTRPGFTAGSLRKIAEALNTMLVYKSPRMYEARLFPATLQALVSQNFPDDFKDFFPALHLHIKKYLVHHRPAPRLSVQSFFNGKTPAVIQAETKEEEGNRFILNGDL